MGRFQRASTWWIVAAEIVFSPAVAAANGRQALECGSPLPLCSWARTALKDCRHYTNSPRQGAEGQAQSDMPGEIWNRSGVGYDLLTCQGISRRFATNGELDASSWEPLALQGCNLARTGPSVTRTKRSLALGPLIGVSTIPLMGVKGSDQGSQGPVIAPADSTRKGRGPAATNRIRTPC